MKRVMVAKGIRLLSVWVIGLFTFVCLLSSESFSDTPLYTSSASRIPGKVYWHTNLSSGWAEAKKRNLPMVIFITSERCTYCDAMKRNSWCNDQIQRSVSSQFVAIELKPGRNDATLSKIDVPAFPTTLVGIPDGKIISHAVGYQPPTELQSLLNRARTY